MADETVARLGALAQRRWGLFTTAQAQEVGVSRNQLSRMASSGVLERIIHGVYRMAGAPAAPHETIYATWLALGGANAAPSPTGAGAVVAAGATAAVVHGIGDFIPDELDFVVPARRGTRLAGVRLRIRPLTPDEVLPVDGLPTMTVERTVADLVGLGTDLSLVAGAVRDAVRSDRLLAPQRLVVYLAATSVHDPDSLADELFDLAGVRPPGWARG